MKLKQKELNKYLTFINKYKSLVGLEDWNVFIKLETKELEEIANAVNDNLEKMLNITLSDKFMKLTDYEQANTLLHELIHGRFAIMRDFQEKGDNDYFEELFINDICKGFTQHFDVEWYD